MARFRWEVPDDFNFAWDAIDVWAEDRGRLAACWPLRRGDGRATFWDVRDRSRRLAGVLAAKGVVAGDIVAIVAPLGLELAVALVAVVRLGAVALPLEPGTKPVAAKAAIGAGGAVATLATPAAAKRLGRPRSRVRLVLGGHVPGWSDAAAAAGSAIESRPRRSSGDPALAVAGGAKGGLVRHSQRWIFAQGYVGEFWLDLRRTDLHAAVASPGDPLGLSLAIFAPWMLGCAVAWPTSRAGLADAVACLPVSTFSAPPAVYDELLEAGFPRGPALRHCVASGPIGTSAAKAWHAATGLAVHTGFGRPECPVFAAHLRGVPVRPGSIGRPFPGHDVVVVDGDGREVDHGEEGELAIRGRPPTLAAVAATSELHRAGARARADEQGYLWLS